MSEVQAPRRRRRRVAGAGLAAATALAALLGLALARDHSASPASARAGLAGQLVVRSAGREVLRIGLTPFVRRGRLRVAALERAVEAGLSRNATVNMRRARITYGYERRAARLALVAVRLGGSIIDVPSQPVSSAIPAPAIRQVQRNICESAALQILLATQGVRTDQPRLQAELPRSGPLDPVGRGRKQVWGDPELGFVGRPGGGGVAGGFGVYERPVADVARRNGVLLDDLTGGRPQAIYRRLLEGLPGIVWVGLSKGPYREWRSPAGRPIRANFGEHTVVLNGLRGDGSLDVVNPLTGRKEVWRRQAFEAMWALLGRRALFVQRV